MTLALEVHGHGPDLVFIHGWGAERGLWRDWVLTHFIPGWRVTLVDLPGHGGSAGLVAASDDALADAWLTALIEVLPVRATLVGWSLGGLLAQGVALRMPERVERLVLLASSPCFVQRDGWLPALEVPLFARYWQEVGQQTASLMRSFFALQTLGSPQPRSLLRQLTPLLSVMGQGSVPALAQGLSLLGRLDYRQQLASLSVPTLWVLGQQDAIVPIALADALAELQPQARVTVLDQAGHLPFLSHGDETARQLLEFLQAGEEKAHD